MVRELVARQGAPQTTRQGAPQTTRQGAPKATRPDAGYGSAQNRERNDEGVDA